MSDYVVELSLDRATWMSADTVLGGNGGRDPLYLPESEARYLRVRALGRTAPVELREAIVQPLVWSATPEAYFTNLAKDASRGTYPRPYVGEQCAWTVVGPDAGREEALLSEDGMVETGKGRCSIEPFLWLDGKLITWADVTTRQWLTPGEPPAPAVGWSHRDVGLTITAFAGKDTASPVVRVQYRVSNPGARSRSVRLCLASRPFQVNPPWQNIGFAGGTAKIQRIEQLRNSCWVNGRLIMRNWPAASGAGAQTLDQGEITDLLRRGQIPVMPAAADRHGFASGVTAFDLEIPPGGEKASTSMSSSARHGTSVRSISRGPMRPSTDDSAGLARPLVSAAGRADLGETVLAQAGYILVNRDAGAIRRARETTIARGSAMDPSPLRPCSGWAGPAWCGTSSSGMRRSSTGTARSRAAPASAGPIR
jgi:hypothetical protein